MKVYTVPLAVEEKLDPAMNQADTDFARVGPANFADGYNAMTTGPNPREISNIVVAQADAGESGPHLMDDNGVALSGMMYAWGQFIDHDLDFEKSGTDTADISMPVPAGDSLPDGTIIPLTRVAIDPDRADHVTDLVETLMGRKPELRFAYIQDHARFVEDVDL